MFDTILVALSYQRSIPTRMHGVGGGRALIGSPMSMSSAKASANAAFISSHCSAPMDEQLQALQYRGGRIESGQGSCSLARCLSVSEAMTFTERFVAWPCCSHLGNHALTSCFDKLCPNEAPPRQRGQPGEFPSWILRERGKQAKQTRLETRNKSERLQAVKAAYEALKPARP